MLVPASVVNDSGFNFRVAGKFRHHSDTFSHTSYMADTRAAVRFVSGDLIRLTACDLAADQPCATCSQEHSDSPQSHDLC